MAQSGYRPSRVSTVLAIVFAGLLGLAALVSTVAGLALFGEAARPVPLLLAVLAHAACAGCALAGCVLLIRRSAAGVAAVTIGAVVALLIVLLDLVLGSATGEANPTGYSSTYHGALVLFGVLALVQARRRDTKQQVGLLP
ncbi:hypothetical protein [Prauserella cavernicola]|uniref:DUF4383 domain-containing protein n=1 Tax=Prauserella cavernicola TaxID=2800127 RepID=A0A934V2Y7_9PSEU|nr:hypothetical protein [Prauserella cavernicola]MBK1782979.1 hypothetical protein [Prauserella cavernicola]